MTPLHRPFRIGSIDPSRQPQTATEGDLEIDGRAVTHDGGWLHLACDAPAMPPAVRAIEVRLRLVFDRQDRAGGAYHVFIDKVRLADIEWRSVDAFFESGGEAWGPYLLDEARNALGILAEVP